MKKQKKEKSWVGHSWDEFCSWIDYARLWLDHHHTCRKAIKYIGVTALISLAGIYSTNPSALADPNVWITAVMVPLVLILHNYLKHLQEDSPLYKLKM